MEYCKFKNNIVRELFSTKAKFLVFGIENLCNFGI